MHNKSKLVILVLLLLILSGCRYELLSPDSLIQAPSNSHEKVYWKQVISDWLSNDEYLTVPLQMDNKMSYKTVDIDRDGEDELVAFIKKDSGYELGFVIFKKNADDEWQPVDKTILSGTSVDYFKVVDLDNDDEAQEMLFGVNIGGTKYLYIYRFTDGALECIGEDIQYDILNIGSLDNTADVQIVTAVRNTTDEKYQSLLSVYKLDKDTIAQSDTDVFGGYCKELLYTKVTTDKCGLYVTMLHNYQMTTVAVLVYENGHLTAKAECLLEDDYASMDDNQIFADINNDGITDVFSFLQPLRNDVGAGYENYARIWRCWDGDDEFKVIKAEIVNEKDGYSFEVPIKWLDTLDYGFEYQGDIAWTVFYYQTDESYVSVFSVAAIDRNVWDNFDALQESALFLGNNSVNNKVYIALIAQNLPEGFQVDQSTLISCLKIDGGRENGR